MDLAAYRKKRLLEAVDFYQFFADADDVDTWMLDTLRLVSSEDVGRDEASVHSLLAKHRNVTDELQNYSSVIQALHEQASNLGEQVISFEIQVKIVNYFARNVTCSQLYFGSVFSEIRGACSTKE